ncbi:MAG TPA: hypothetical protein VD903_01685 [Pseudonocardia sp.]|nr:hypothetical protein [Pseudonocardia sp.]
MALRTRCSVRRRRPAVLPLPTSSSGRGGCSPPVTQDEDVGPVEGIAGLEVIRV